MLYSKIKIGEKEVELAPLKEGEKASLTDYAYSENEKTKIVVLECTKEGGEIWVSNSGFTIESGHIRQVHSTNYIVEKKFTDEYSRKIRTRFGEGTLTLKYTK